MTLPAALKDSASPVLSETDSSALISRFANEATGTAHSIVDIGCNFRELSIRVEEQGELLQNVRQKMGELSGENTRITESAEASRRVAHVISTELTTSIDVVRNSIRDINDLVHTATEGHDLVLSLRGALEEVSKVAASIESIASQTKLLALNATIEAARAGPAGQGFAVVANEVKALSEQTAKATKAITNTVGELDAKSQKLIVQGERSAELAQSANEATANMSSTLDGVETNVKQVASETVQIIDAANGIDQRSKQLSEYITRLNAGFENSAMNVAHVESRLGRLQSAGEALLETTAASNITTADTPFRAEVIRLAAKVSDVLTDAVDQNRIRLEDVFDTNYQKISGSNPEQFNTRYVDLFDRLLQPIFDGALSFDGQVVFCAAVDKNGYLPTHNSKFSKPQSDDPVWNAANCRNRRFFKDRVGLGAGRNTEPSLAQTYERDMGGGRFAPMVDVSAPVMVKGRHWGGLRLAYALKTG